MQLVVSDLLDRNIIILGYCIYLGLLCCFARNYMKWIPCIQCSSNKANDLLARSSLYISNKNIVLLLMLIQREAMEMLLSKALTCINFFLYKQKWLFYHGDGYIWLYCCMNTQITLRPNMQLLSTQQHVYQSFLSYFLVLFRLQYCDTLCEL